MQITHEEARKLIQFDADDPLKDKEKNLLEGHLASCVECRQYAGEIREVESTLGFMMKRRWNNQHLSPSRTISVPKSSSKKWIHNAILATRIAAMGVICIAFLFNIWQFTQSSGQGSKPSSASVPPVPTPSLYSTSTRILDQDCKQVSYTVKSQDTLEKIATQFSVTTEEIMAANHMNNGTLHPSMNLLIPICETTTPGTPDTVTTTFTPLSSQTTSTPINGPTQ